LVNITSFSKYIYPSAEGGPGKFLIAYTDPSSPYNVTGVYLNATTGAIEFQITIGSSYKYATSGTVGIAYNGTYFVVAWPDSNEDIVSQMFDLSGNPVLPSPQKISTMADENQWADVAYNYKTGNYYFVWYNYDRGHNYGSFWTADEYIPEFSALLPIVAVAFVAFFVYRRKH